MTVWWLSNDCRLSNNYPITIQWHFDDCPITVWWLYDDCLVTILWLHGDCSINYWWLSNDCPLFVWNSTIELTSILVRNLARLDLVRLHLPISYVQGKNCNKLQYFSIAPPYWPKPISSAYFNTSHYLSVVVHLNIILARVYIQYRHPVLYLEASGGAKFCFFGHLGSLGSNEYFFDYADGTF